MATVQFTRETRAVPSLHPNASARTGSVIDLGRERAARKPPAPRAPVPRPPATSQVRGEAVPVPRVPAEPPAGRQARVIYMASLGGYMAVHNSNLLEVKGRMVWPTVDDLARDALTVGVVASTLVIDTSRG